MHQLRAQFAIRSEDRAAAENLCHLLAHLKLPPGMRIPAACAQWLTRSTDQERAFFASICQLPDWRAAESLLAELLDCAVMRRTPLTAGPAGGFFVFAGELFKALAVHNPDR